jgi:hypothetical protein
MGLLLGQSRCLLGKIIKKIPEKYENKEQKIIQKNNKIEKYEKI